MFTDTINRQAFEFTCRAEGTAKKIQHEIEAHTAAQINEIISSVLSRAGEKGRFLMIDKIEIDLGNIAAFDFGSTEMLTHFGELLYEEIVKTKKNNPAPTTGNINNDTPASATFNHELEMITSFILQGNVPWWVDKNTPLNIDAIVQKMILHHPEALKQLLEDHSANPAVVLRLFTQMNAVTVSKIKELVPLLSAAVPKEKFIYESAEAGIDFLSPQQIKKLREIFNTSLQPSVFKIKQSLAYQLIRFYSALKMNNLSAEESALEKLFTKLNLPALYTLISAAKNQTVSRRKERETKKEIIASVKNLTVFQSELFLFELSQSFVPGKIDEPGTMEDQELTGMINPVDADTITIFSGTSLGEPPVSLTVENEHVEEGYAAEGYIDEGYTNDNVANENIQPGNIDKGTPVVSNETQLASAAENIANDEAVPPHVTSTDTDQAQVIPDFFPLKKNNPEFLAEAGEQAQLPSKKAGAGKSRMIAFIMKRLRTTDPAIQQYLSQVEKEKLQQITATFKQHMREHFEYKKLVSNLVDDPLLLKNNIFGLFASLVPRKEQNLPGMVPKNLLSRIQLSQSAFLAHINKLSVKELVTIKDIFQKGVFETSNEKNFIKKTLLKLPKENILLLKFLTELPPEDIDQLRASVKNPAAADYPATGNEGPQYYKNEGPQNLYIENAGLCLLAPYLPGFFKQLGYLENGAFRNKGFAMRAIYILQYITSGKIKSPEYLLQFNKLLCGFRIDDYITKSTRLSKKEISEAGSLVEAVIRNWKALKNTSPDGLRESFLKRKGILFENDSKWTLQVEKKGYDVLLNTMPWGYSMIKFPWMKKFIQVEWH
ncbi:MAG: contractile injection system tape measure protein [Ferruginibacter sp.]